MGTMGSPMRGQSPVLFWAWEGHLWGHSSGSRGTSVGLRLWDFCGISGAVPGVGEGSYLCLCWVQGQWGLYWDVCARSQQSLLSGDTQGCAMGPTLAAVRVCAGGADLGLMGSVLDLGTSGS